MSDAQLAQQMEKNITLSTIDLSAMPALMDSVSNLAFTLQDCDQ